MAWSVGFEKLALYSWLAEPVFTSIASRTLATSSNSRLSWPKTNLSKRDLPSFRISCITWPYPQTNSCRVPISISSNRRSETGRFAWRDLANLASWVIQNSGRKKQEGAKKREHRFERNTQKPQRQRDQPYQRKEHKRQQRYRPTKHKQNA